MASVTSSGKGIATGTQQQQQNEHHVGPSLSAASGAQQPEDELRKKNTDCVYFLASPLTCKKGSECEYRHSEYARINPRDCFFWLNGNCLNPKCAFRHPPLDGLLGTQDAVPAGAVGPSLPPPQLVAGSAYNPAKQAVSCVFFQKGYCMKGDQCQFIHGPTTFSSKVSQVPAAGGVTEPANFKNAFGHEKCNQQNIFQRANAAKSVEIPNHSIISAKVASAFPVNGMPAGKGAPPNNGYKIEHPRPRAPAAHPCNGILKSKSSIDHHSIPVDDQSFQNSKDAEESLRESSPGFDVLVDDQHGDTEYYHNEDQLAGLGRNMDEFEYVHPDYYNSEADADQDRRFHDPPSYDFYDHRQQRYGYEQSRASSERSTREAAHFDRRGHLKAETTDRVRESDLRNILKRRKVGNLRSVICTDYAPASHVEDRSYRNTRRDVHHSPSLENSHRSRLEGRLRDRRSSPVYINGVYRERETKGRLQNRLGRRIQDDAPDLKSFNNFAAPKRLAELKVSKKPYGEDQEQPLKRQQSPVTGKRKLLDESQQGEGDLSFEGPKPLSEILKSKKRPEASATSDQREENHVELAEQTDSKEEHKQMPSSVSSVPEAQLSVQTLNKMKNNLVIPNGSKVEFAGSDNKLMSIAPGASEANKPNVPESEEGRIDGEDDYHEGAEGEYDYEEGEGEGDYYYEYEEGDVEGYEGEKVEGEDGYMEEDDGDDFAKRIGIVPS